MERRVREWKATQRMQNYRPEPVRGYVPNAVDLEAIEREAKAARQLMEQMK